MAYFPEVVLVDQLRSKELTVVCCVYVWCCRQVITFTGPESEAADLSC